MNRINCQKKLKRIRVRDVSAMAEIIICIVYFDFYLATENHNEHVRLQKLWNSFSTEIKK